MPIIRPTLDELKEFIRLFPHLDEMTSLLIAEIHERPDNFFELLDTNFYWSGVYVYSFMEHAMILTSLIGQLETFIELSNSEKPNSAYIDFARSATPEMEVELEHEPKFAIGTWIALSKSIESVKCYGIPLNDQITRIKNGNDKALFEAVRIDRTITSNPTVADRISKAEILSDHKFFDDLKKALNGPPKNRDKYYGRLRYMLLLLDENGMLDEMTDVQRYELLQEELNLYNPTSTPHTLDTFIRRWREDTST